MRRMRNRVLACFLVSLMALAWTFVPASPAAASGVASWTFLVYLAGDNNLDTYGVLNVNQLQSLPDSSDVNVIVLWDRAGTYEDGLYKVVNNPTSGTLDFTDNQSRLEKIAVPAEWYIPGTSELATNDPVLLAQVVNHVVKAYPADHYALDFWDHGGGWRGMCWDDNSYPPTGDEELDRIINHLTFGDVREALTVALGGGTMVDRFTGASVTLTKTDLSRLDVLAFDACLLQDIEGTYELRDVGHYFVGSEDSTPGYGYPYHYIIGGLKADPGMTPYGFSRLIVDSFVTFYEENRQYYGGQVGEQQSVVDLENIGGLVRAVDGLARAIIADPSMTVAGALDSAQKFYAHSGQSWLPAIDLMSATENLFGTQWDAAARDVAEAFNQAVLYSRFTGKYTDPHGLTIFCPNNPNGNPAYAFYRDWYIENSGVILQFVVDTQWDEFLTAYWNNFN